MTYDLQRLANATDVDAALAAIARDGAVIIEQMIPAETIQAMRAAIVDHANGVAPGSQANEAFWRKFHGARTKRFTRLGTISPTFFDVLANLTMRAIADSILLPHCGSYWLNTAQAMLIGPGEPAQILHRDRGNWDHLVTPLWPNAPEVTISAMIALDQTTDALGATRVIPGSHLWDDYRHRGAPEDSIPAELAAGSALVYSGKVLHGGGANTTVDGWRNAMHMSFVLGWLTPEDANSLQYTHAEVANPPDRSKRLLGFSSYDPLPHPAGRL